GAFSNDPATKADLNFVEFDLHLGGTASINKGVNFDLGIPALNISASLNPTITFTWAFNFGFGVSAQKGFYFVADPHALNITININLGSTVAVPSTAGGQILFLSLDLTDEQHDFSGLDPSDTGSHFSQVNLSGNVALDSHTTLSNTMTGDIQADPNKSGAFDLLAKLDGNVANLYAGEIVTDSKGAIPAGDTIRITNGMITLATAALRAETGDTLTFQDRSKSDGSAEKILTFADFSGAHLSDIIKPSLTGDADLAVKMKVDFGALAQRVGVPSLADVLPAVQADLIAHWGLSITPQGGANFGEPYLAFENISLDVGS